MSFLLFTRVSGEITSNQIAKECFRTAPQARQTFGPPTKKLNQLSGDTSRTNLPMVVNLGGVKNFWGGEFPQPRGVLGFRLVDPY